MSDEVLPNPVINDEIESKLLEAAGLADAGRDIPQDLLPEKPEQTEESVETEENVPTEAELADPANKDRARDPVSGKFIKRKPLEAQNAPTEAVDASKTASDAQPVSDYQKKKDERAAKEKERLDRTWENVNRQKEELESRRKQLEQREQQFRNPQQQRQAPQRRDFSSQQLWEAGQDFTTQEQQARVAAKKALEIGDYDEFGRQNDAADKMSGLARQAYENASQFFTMEEQEAQQAAFEKHNQGWIANMDAEMKAMPELKKPDSPIAQELMGLLKTHGTVFQMLPDGFKQAREIAQLRLDAKDAPTLREQLKIAKAEVDRLNGLTAPSAGGVTSTPTSGGKTFDKMSTDEQERHVLAMAERMDSGQ